MSVDTFGSPPAVACHPVLQRGQLERRFSKSGVSRSCRSCPTIDLPKSGQKSLPHMINDNITWPYIALHTLDITRRFTGTSWESLSCVRADRRGSSSNPMWFLWRHSTLVLGNNIAFGRMVQMHMMPNAATQVRRQEAATN